MKKQFIELCTSGKLEEAKKLFEKIPTIDISAEHEDAFQRDCMYGRLESAKWLLKVNPTIDISAEDDYAFRSACQNGHLEVAKWLLEVEPDIYPFIDMYISGQAGNDDTESDAFITEQKRFEVAEWLVSLYPEKYYLEREDNIDGNYQISKKPEYRSEKCPCCKQYIK
jgi:hypothetical protein